MDEETVTFQRYGFKWESLLEILTPPLSAPPRVHICLIQPCTEELTFYRDV